MSEPRDKPVAGPSVEMPLPAAREREARARIDAGARARAVEAPPLQLGHTSSLEPELRALGDALDLLSERMGRYGSVETTRGGWPGRLELALKRALRKLVQRHVDQQKEVHEALRAVLDRLRDVLASEHVLMDENAQALSDEALRRTRRDREA